jgi:hypothetical protein
VLDSTKQYSPDAFVQSGDRPGSCAHSQRSPYSREAGAACLSHAAVPPTCPAPRSRDAAPIPHWHHRNPTPARTRRHQRVGRTACRAARRRRRNWHGQTAVLRDAHPGWAPCFYQPR